jgi:hypothetical protein
MWFCFSSLLSFATFGHDARNANGNQQQGDCHLFDLALETASWSSRPCNQGRCAITYIHSERLNTRATHTQCCPGQPGGNFIAGFFTVKSPANRVRGATASGYGNILRDCNGRGK